MTTLQVTVRRIYGVERICPVNEAAQIAVRLVNAKTLTLDQINLFRCLGMTIEYAEVQTPMQLGDELIQLLRSTKPSNK